MTQTFSKLPLNLAASTYHSVQSTTLDTSASKKRLFVRKPGPSTLILQPEKQRKPSSSGVDNEENYRHSQTFEKIRQTRQKEESKTMRVHRHTQTFKKECLIPSPFSASKQIVPSLSQSKLDLLAGLKYIQRPVEKGKNQNGSSRKYPVILTSDLESQRNFNLDDTTDNSLKSQRTRNTQNFTKTGIFTSQVNLEMDVQFKNIANTVSCNDLVPTSEDEFCFYCKNVKKVNQILQEKCSKLQQQLQIRQQDIKVLKAKIETMKEQSQSFISQQTKLREENYLRQMQIYQQCSARYENARKQLSRVAQRVKYLQIQNGVLARYKQDCNQAKKDYERIKLQNDNLKRQISSICRMGHKYNNNSKKLNGTQSHRQRQHPTAKSPYLKIYKEEDTISLQLSEASYQHI